MFKILLFLLATFVVGCAMPEGPTGPSGATGMNGAPGLDGAPGEVIVIEPTMPSAIEQLVASENEYRDLLGSSQLTQGLTCTLYTVPNGSAGIVGTTLANVAIYSYKGAFNQADSPASDGLNVLPPALRSLYTSWYVVRCTGKIVVIKSEYIKFDLTSDDGSLLYINGSLLINNDGNHGSLMKSGTKLLKAGLYDFRLDYMQGPAGNQSLILNVPAEQLYH